MVLSKDKITRENKSGYFAAGNGGIIDNLTTKERFALRKLYLDEQSLDMLEEEEDVTDWGTESNADVTVADTNKTKVTFLDASPAKQPSKKMSTAKSNLEKLFSLGCFTPEDMILKMGEDYLELSLETNGLQKIGTLLHMNQVKTASTLTAFECILQFNQDENEGPLLQVIKDMGLEEQTLKKVLGTILTKQGGKRGCIWFYGPGGTGKTLLASLICQAVVNFGMVTTSNPNFPWTDCGNRNICWAEECGNLGNFVEDFKAITGGGNVKVDTKNKQPQSIKGTMIVTSNTNITKVTVGCVETSAHVEPLKQRMVKVRCMHRINPRSKLTPGMLRKWLSTWDMKPMILDHEMPELYVGDKTTGQDLSASSASNLTGSSLPTTAETVDSASTRNFSTPKRAASSAPLKQPKKARHE